MNFTFFTFGILVLLLLVGIKRFFTNNELFNKYRLALDGAMFAICFLVLGLHFYEKKEKAGLLAVGMGATAIVKYLYDKSKTGKEN